MTHALIVLAAQAAAAIAPPPAARPIDPYRWFDRDDYPPAAMRVAAEGRTGFRVAVGADGRAAACDVTQSSGNADLDAATCRIVLARARFAPGGAPSEYRGVTRWILPIDPEDICPETVLDLMVSLNGPAKGRRLYAARKYPARFQSTGYRLRSVVTGIDFDTSGRDRWTLTFALAEPVAALTPFFLKAYDRRAVPCDAGGCAWPGPGEPAATQPHILRGAALRPIARTERARLVCDYVPDTDQ